jgi:hypothetical protein
MANIVQKDYVRWEVFFEDLPEWVIPLIKIIPQFYTDEEYNGNWDDLNFDYTFNYFWENIDQKNWKLYIYLNGDLRDKDMIRIPLYVNLSIWIINTNTRNNIQHSLGY